ncbi:hypothetical protein [Aminobacter carboxidus]|uniref:hypothetical protein n=1 Tax=Aminobacter carboxidus TaxID=376165 RepID=UPI0031B5F652
MSSNLPTLLSFALTSLIIELTPGPNMTYLALVSAGEGRRAGFATWPALRSGSLRSASLLHSASLN